jgi:hypothetical protein
MSRVAKVVLFVVNGILGLFVLANLSESARGDDYFVGFIAGDLMIMASASACIVALDFAFRRLRRRRVSDPSA